MMIPDIPEASADGTPLTASQRNCMKELIDRLREITLKIEELDAKEERVQGDSSSGRDQLRAINIARIVYVNQQKDIERKLDDVLNSCPPEPELRPQPDPVTGPGQRPGSSQEPEELDDLELEPREMGDLKLEPREMDEIELEPREMANVDIEPTVDHFSMKPIRNVIERELIKPIRHMADVVLSPREAIRGRLERKPEARPPPEPEPRMKEKKKSKFQFNVLSFKICPVCEARVPANFRRCGRCATRLDNICSHCGMAVPEGVSFCGKCGKTLA